MAAAPDEARAPDGQMEDDYDPFAPDPPQDAPPPAPEAPRPPIVLKGMRPPDPPSPMRPASSPTRVEPEPHVAGAGNGRIFWNTSRQPPPGPTWHDIIRNSRFPGW